VKKETKELVKWIRNHIAMKAEETFVPYDNMRAQAEAFIDSLPEIESHLCRGGYIQDKNGKPCCEGDQIINPSLLDGKKELGKLYWSVSDCRFYCKVDGKCHGLTIGVNGFEKMEE
jgi:hypothetical protein